jgi:hypothetical protein
MFVLDEPEFTANYSIARYTGPACIRMRLPLARGPLFPWTPFILSMRRRASAGPGRTLKARPVALSASLIRRIFTPTRYMYT